ncbi:MAG: hypothetical protein V1724_02385, partial [Chloroflexota bacterium]
MCHVANGQKTCVASIVARSLLVLGIVLVLVSSMRVNTVGAAGKSEDSRWTTFTTQDGLIGNNVHAIWGDNHTIWFGTDEGVSRYDGMKWKSFTAAEGLAGNKVKAIWGDGKGAVWIGTSTGLSRYDGASWQTFTRKDGLSGNNVRGIWGDQQGHVWVATEPVGQEAGGVDFYDGTGWRSLWELVPYRNTLQFYQEYSLPSLTITSTTGGSFAAARAVRGDTLGNVWVAHGLALGDGHLLSGGISRYDGTRWQSFTTENSELPDDNVNVLWADADGLWAGTSMKGVSRFDGHEWRTFGEQAAGKTISALWGDGNGRIWAGALQAGASYYNGQGWRRFTREDGLASDTVQAIWGDADGRVWFGTDRGVSLFNTKAWDPFQIQDSLPANDVQAVWGDGAGGVWLGTAGAGVAYHKDGRWRLFTERDGLPGNRVTDIWGSGPDDVWVALGGDGVVHFDGYRWQAIPRQEALGFNYVYGLWGNSQGTLWFATAGGLKRFDGWKWCSFTTRDGLATESVKRVIGDRAGNLWLGYRFEEIPVYSDPARLGVGAGAGSIPLWPGGVGRYDGQRFINYTRADGLGANDVNAIWPDEQGWVWVGGKGHLSRFDGNRWKVVDGGPSWATAIWGDAKGNLWFGSQRTAGADLEAVITRFDGSTWHSYTTTQDGLASGEITHIWGDGSGWILVAHSNLWSGTGGVSAFDGSRWQTWQVKNGPVVPELRALARDASGRLWLGTRKGISVLDGSQWRNLGLKDGLVSLDVEDIWTGKSGEVWVAHGLSSVYPEQGGVSRFDGTKWVHYSTSDGLGGKDVNTLWGDNQGGVWAGGEVWEKGKGWVARFDGSRWQSFPVEGGTVEAIWGDGRGAIWFSMADGVNSYDGRQWRYYPSLRSVVEKNYADLVTVIGSNPLWAIDSEKRVWIADKGGAARYDGKIWQSFNSATGLAGDEIRNVLL